MEVAPCPKRILYVITKAAWGGAQRYVYDLATAAASEGHKVAVAVGGEGPLTERLKEAGIRVYAIGSLARDISLYKEWQAFAALRRYIRAFKPDVVHANSSKAGGLTALAARMSSVKKIIFTAHGWAFNEGRPWWQRAVIWLFHYATVLLTDTTICVSGAIKEDAARMPFVAHKLVVVRNGADPLPLLPREQARELLAPGRSERLWIGSIAELHPTKNLLSAVEAFAQIRDDFPNVLFVIMGEGQQRTELESRIEERKLHDHVRLVGHRANAASYLAALDVFILPSRSEALGYVLLEAGHAGIPVIASRVGGIPEVVRHDSDGLLVAPNDISGFAAAMRSLFGDPQKRQALGASLKARVATHYSKARMVAETLERYR